MSIIPNSGWLCLKLEPFHKCPIICISFVFTLLGHFYFLCFSAFCDVLFLYVYMSFHNVLFYMFAYVFICMSVHVSDDENKDDQSNQ